MMPGRAPEAKGKKKRREKEEDAEALKEYEKSIVQNVVRPEHVRKHRDDLPSNQVVWIIADEIQLIYSESGQELDEHNAHDKALTLWRKMKYHGHISAREQTVDHVLCEKHS